MKSRVLHTIIFLLAATASSFAADSTQAVIDTTQAVIDTTQNTARIVQYADTFKLQEQTIAVDESALMWALLSQQALAIHERDSLAEIAHRDSLIAALHERDSVIRATIAELERERDLLLDSLNTLVPAEETLAEAEIQIDSVQLAMDSLTYQLARENHLPTATIQKSIIRDAQADLDDINAALHERKYWKRELNCLAHFTQNYATPNWYKGGNSSFSGLLQLKGYYNYAKDRLAWDNNLEWKAGATTTGDADTLRKYNVTDDIFRIQSKVGYEVMNKLYVSGSIEFNTTLWTVWNTNTKTAKTAFMTPAKFYINGGLDYKPLSGLTLNLSPAVYRLVYAYWGKDPQRIDVTSFGIPAGEQLVHEFGSSFRVDWEYKPIREVAIDTELYFYTNYRAVEIDWEVTVDFIINRFLTTRLTLHPRYDSNYKINDEEHAKIQFKELISIGFAHKFR